MSKELKALEIRVVANGFMVLPCGPNRNFAEHSEIYIFQETKDLFAWLEENLYHWPLTLIVEEDKL